jgi:Anaerobic ribonucleoside-triphosphate reductase
MFMAILELVHLNPDHTWKQAKRRAAMSMMTIQRLHDLFDENSEKEVLAWPGTCHDCGAEITVTATPQTDGIHVDGGSVYEPILDRFFVKCPDCFGKDQVLRNFQHCEVYSRVVGYLRPVGQWNDAKAAEFSDRGLFDASLD